MSILQAIFNVTLTRLFAVFGFTLCLGACSSMDELIPNDKLIIEGQGEAVIVLEAGAGDGPSAWLPIRPLLAKEATVVSYWRDQPWQTSPITGQDVAEKLKMKLQAQGLKPPYILVGHSLGGPYVLSFAYAYPELVKAVVLVDGRPAGFTEACQQAKGQLCDIPTLAKLTMPPWLQAEIDGLPITYRQHQQYRQFPNIPVLVWSATEKPLLADDIFMRVWLEQQQLQAAKFKQGRFKVFPNTGHYIHHEHPQMVSAEILKLRFSNDTENSL